MSSTKKVLKSFHLLSKGNMSVPLVSKCIDVTYMDNAGLEVRWTGLAVGSITVMASISDSLINPNPDDADINNYFSLTFDPALAQPAGADGKFGINLNQLPFPRFLIVWEPSDNEQEGEFDVFVSAKEI